MAIKEGEQYKILIVEDNPGDVRLTQEALRQSTNGLDFELVTAYDGEEAMDVLNKAATEKLPHLIILDLNIPKKSGLEVLKEVKEDDRFKSIPLVVLTSSEAGHDIARSYEGYANSYVSKPVDFDSFCQTISRIVNFWFKIATIPRR